MAFSIRYARLFQVKILHGYHLDKGAEKNFYELNDADDTDSDFKRKALERYGLEQQGVVIKPTPATKALLRGQNMVFRTTQDGFFVGVKVEEQIVGSDTLLYPKIPLAEGAVFQFRMETKQPDWLNTAGLSINPNLRANYYFTNFEEAGQLASPSLSLQAGPRASRFYEMGELAYDALGGQLYEAITGVNSNIPLSSLAHWKPVTDYRFVNESDHVLLPLRFTYRFTPNQGVNLATATFTIYNPSGDVVAGVNTNGSPLREYVLDFRRLGIPEGRYTLQVQADGGYQDEKQVLVDESLYQPGSFSTIAISHREGLPDALRLFEADGALRRVGSVTQHPVFEIRFPARKAYWRYFLHPEQNGFTTPSPAGDLILDPADGQRLLTKEPKPVTRYGTMINYDSGHMLPNPTRFQVDSVWDGTSKKNFMDIYLNRR